MKHLIRIILILCGLIVLLLGTTVLAFHLLFPPSKLQRMATDFIRGSFTREAQIGRMSAGFSGIRIEDFTLSEYPDFKAGTFLKGDNFILRWQLLPLLQHRLVVIEAELRSPTVEIYRTGSGEYNFSTLSRGLEGKRSNNLVFLPALLVSGLTVKDGTLLLKDSGVTLRKIDLAARDISLIAPFNADVAFTIEKGNLAANLAGTARVNVKAQTIEFKDATLSVAGKPALRLTGTVADFARPGLRFNVRVKGDRATFESLASLIPGLAALQFFITPTVDLTLSGTPENLKISFNR